MEKSIEEVVSTTPKNGKKFGKFLKKIGAQVSKQLTAIVGIAFATGIGVVVARVVWEWIKFVWNF